MKRLLLASAALGCFAFASVAQTTKATTNELKKNQMVTPVRHVIKKENREGKEAKKEERHSSAMPAAKSKEKPSGAKKAVNRGKKEKSGPVKHKRTMRKGAKSPKKHGNKMAPEKMNMAKRKDKEYKKSN